MGELKIPSTIGRWTVTSKLGSGAFGDVYLVKRYRKHAKQYGFAAMKIEEHQKSRDDEVLRMEIFVLMKLQGQMSFTTIYDKGQTKNFSYVIMSLLMKPVEEFRQDQPTRRFSILTTLKIGLQMINAIHKLHHVGYIHRDIKPANMAPGFKNPLIIYLFDFGLARCIYSNLEKKILRTKRTKVDFRGTYRYCSYNAHVGNDQGRVDDMWGILYCLIEFRRKLPWTGVKPNDSKVYKKTAKDEDLFIDCPPSLNKIKNDIMQLKFYDAPNYSKYINWIEEDIKGSCEDFASHKFEWQNRPEITSAVKKKRDREETERTCDTRYSSQETQDQNSEEIDDTLDDLPSDSVIMALGRELKKKKEEQTAMQHRKSPPALQANMEKQPDVKKDKGPANIPKPQQETKDRQQPGAKPTQGNTEKQPDAKKDKGPAKEHTAMQHRKSPQALQANTEKQPDVKKDKGPANIPKPQQETKDQQQPGKLNETRIAIVKPTADKQVEKHSDNKDKRPIDKEKHSDNKDKRPIDKEKHSDNKDKRPIDKEKHSDNKDKRPIDKEKHSDNKDKRPIDKEKHSDNKDKQSIDKKKQTETIPKPNH